MEKLYKLIDPNTLQVRYIGKTEKQLVIRLMGHIREAGNGTKTHKCNWIRSLLKLGKIPHIRIIKRLTPQDDWRKFETYYIAKYRKLGHHLTNGTDGGEGVTMTQETRNKISLKGGKPIRGINIKTSEIINFKSAREAAKVLKISSARISKCLRGHRIFRGKTDIIKSAGGYKWERVNLK